VVVELLHDRAGVATACRSDDARAKGALAVATALVVRVEPRDRYDAEEQRDASRETEHAGTDVSLHQGLQVRKVREGSCATRLTEAGSLRGG